VKDKDWHCIFLQDPYEQDRLQAWLAEKRGDK